MELIEIQWQSDRFQQEIELRDRLLRKPLGLTFTPQDSEQEEQQLHFGVVIEDELVACLVVVPIEEFHVKIRQMCVAQSLQRQGIGSWLIRQTEDVLAQRGIASIELNARQMAIGFYERLGYEKEGDPFVEVGIPHCKMVKRIKP